MRLQDISFFKDPPKILENQFWEVVENLHENDAQELFWRGFLVFQLEDRFSSIFQRFWGGQKSR